MKTDIEIAQEAVMEPITKVAESIGIEADDLELYGKYKAKLSEEFLRKDPGSSQWETDSGNSYQPNSCRRG